MFVSDLCPYSAQCCREGEGDYSGCDMYGEMNAEFTSLKHFIVYFMVVPSMCVCIHMCVCE